MLIDHMENGLSYETFAAIVNVSKQTLYDWEKANPEFLDSKKHGVMKSQLFWEKAGMDGLFINDKDTKFNSTVWVFSMKNRFNWRDKQQVESENVNVEESYEDYIKRLKEEK